MRKRPAAIDFWDYPAYYNGPREDDDVEEVQPEQQVEESQGQSQPTRKPVAAEQLTGTSFGKKISWSRNKDVLNPTCVTPLVANLSQHLFRDLVVAGPFIHDIDLMTRRILVRNPRYIEFMDRLLEIVHAPPSHVEFENTHIARTRDHKTLFTYYKAVTINTIIYNINEIVIIPAGEDGRKPPPEFPMSAPRTNPHAFAGDLFWFAKILAIKRDNYTAHVQWLQHGCNTMFEELAHPQELFLTNLCGDIPLASILARCRCQRFPLDKRPKTLLHDVFFYSLSWSSSDSVFREISELEDNPGKGSTHPGTCGLCISHQEATERADADFTRITRDGLFIGITSRGSNYHRWDSVLIRSGEGPCNIGQITSIAEDLASQSTDSFKLTVKLFGIVNDLARRGTGQTADVYEDRHLFLTDEKLDITCADLLGKCYVLQRKSVRNLRTWLASSTTHYFVSAHTPSLKHASSETLNPLAARDFSLCGGCMDVELRRTESFLRWKGGRKTHPLRIFDPFAGVGGFALGVCEVGNMKLTHAIEISSSAAKTLKENSPDTIVYNQCSNKMLEYAVASVNNSRETLKDLLNDERLPPPPRRGEIDCIVSGFPCQPHSTLNMFQKADDLGNELFLNTISWVDHLRPNYCLFENVEGFTSYKINATQKNQHTVQGGIEKGGFKFLVRALTAMGYQVRFGLLQAAHYGTPQSRVRFFLWAARAGYPLPEFPARTHDFPARAVSMEIRFPNGDVVAPIDASRGVAPLPFVTVGDAISDLKRWDWKNPRKVYKERLERRDILQVRSHYEDDSCGLLGDIPYEHPPRSAYQARSRRRSVEDIQHITPCYNDETVESVVNIPIEAGANYRSLNSKPLLWQWQNMNASSANARRGYKTTTYARLEEDGYFNTTVTNVGVTAKQSKVLNPWCKRIVTVRELARSQGFPDDFKFHALDGKVKTMHKQIGNAVPWPLGEALGRELEKALYRKEENDQCKLT